MNMVERIRQKPAESHWAGDAEPVADVQWSKNTIWKSGGEYLRDLIKSTNPGGAVTQDFQGRISKAVQGMSTVSASEGGIAVLPEMSKKILEVQRKTPSLLEMCDVYNIAGNSISLPRNAETSRVDGSRAGGVRGYWVEQGGTGTKSQPALDNLDLKLKKLVVVVYLTQELIDDNGLALEQYVAKKVAEEIGFQVGNSIINGTGVGQPLGILSSPALVTASKKVSQTATTIVAENIVAMWKRLFADSHANAVWLYNQDTLDQYPAMGFGTGTTVAAWLPPGGLSGNQYATLMGRPMIPVEWCSTLGTAGDLVLADLSGYAAATKGGVAQAQSMHVEFLTDQVALRFTMRMDGAPWLKGAITPFKGSNTQSHFVTVETRS